MATLIRVKRRLGEEPLETILVRPKRRRVEGDGGEEATTLPPSTILERVATLDSKDTSIEPSALREYKKSWELRQSYKKLGSSEGWREAGRRQAKERGRESRYLITASHRVSSSTTTTDLDRQDNILSKMAAEDKGCSPDATDKKIQFYDAQISSLHTEEDVITCNGQAMQSEKYVFDIYYHPDSMDWAEFVCEQPKLMMEEEEEEEGEEDEDDENAENNWRNEYPEEEEDEDEDEYRDEDSYWGRPLRGRALLKHKSDESFDADEYDEDEDSDECSFDKYGNLITSSVSHLGARLALTVLSSGEESEGEGERERL